MGDMQTIKRVLSAFALVLVIGLGTPSGAVGQSEVPEVTCFGESPTIVGTIGDDRLKGTADRDVIWGDGGNDTIWGRGGDDIICGGPGDDRIFGGGGADQIDGGDANDSIRGGRGDDVVVGGSGDDQLHGDAGIDDIYGGAGDDRIPGGPGDDRMFGGPGSDRISGPGNNLVEQMGPEGPGEPVEPGSFFAELSEVALAGSAPAGSICDSPPLGFQVISTFSVFGGDDDPSTFFTVDVPAGLSLRGTAYFESSVDLASGIADDQVIRFDAFYTNIETGLRTNTPDPFTLWQQRPDRPATTQDDVLMSSGFALVGPGPVLVEARAGVEIYRGVEGSVTATVILTPSGPGGSRPCADLCVENGGELYVENPGSIDGESVKGCYQFGPRLRDLLESNPDAEALNELSNALTAANVIVDIVSAAQGSPVNPAGYVLGQAMTSSGESFIIATVGIDTGGVEGGG